MLLPLKKGPQSAPALNVFASKGVREKPEQCALCPFATKGAGFVPDWYPDRDKPPQLGLLLNMPSSDDVVEQRPWSGRAGYAWEQKYLKPFGLSLTDVYIGHVVRCQPKDRKWGKPVYPIGTLKRHAEITCRQHDGKCGPDLHKGGMKSFDPNMFVVTFHPSDALLVPALSRLIQADIGKAVRRMNEGYRPLVLMGTEAKDLLAPWLKGGIKSWRGSYWKGEYPFKEGSMLLEPRKGFLEF